MLVADRGKHSKVNYKWIPKNSKEINRDAKQDPLQEKTIKICTLGKIVKNLGKKVDNFEFCHWFRTSESNRLSKFATSASVKIF